MAETSKQQELADGAGPEAPAKPKSKRQPAKTPPRKMPPWKVILHNDDVNEMDHVVRVLRRLTPLSQEEAMMRTLEAHESGVSLLLTTHQERAELYVEQFASMGLTATCEPDA